MPEFRVYIPESKSGVMYQFKEQFGKEGSSMIVTFMEEALTGKSVAPENPEAETARTYVSPSAISRQILSRTRTRSLSPKSIHRFSIVINGVDILISKTWVTLLLRMIRVAYINIFWLI